jgi:acetyl-CoA synthetase
LSADVTDIYREARDFLRSLGRDYAKAVREFSWPDFGERFNWAVDWFDANARGNDGTALWIVEEDGAEAKYSFDEMAGLTP